MSGGSSTGKPASRSNGGADPLLPWQVRKAELDAANEGGVPTAEENYPPHEVPLLWEEFRAFAAEQLHTLSLAR